MSSNPAPTSPPASFTAGWLLRALENATSLEVITRLMQDYYKLTGTWPDPKQASGPSSNPVRPQVRVVDHWESPEQDFQPPLPGIARPVAVPEGRGLLRQGKYQVTGYDYHQDSPYRREAARRLLSKILPEKLPTSIEARLEAGELEYVERMMSLHLPLGCLDLYTLMIAWSHLPVFLDASGKALGYMTLSLKRMAREPGVKSDTVYRWLGLLQHYQLIEVGNLQTGNIIQPNEYELLKERIQNISRVGNSLFSGRAIQTSSTFYRVKPEVSPMPIFQPGTRGGDVGDRLGSPDLTSNQQGDTLKSPQVAPNGWEDTSHLTPTSPPSLHDYELINDDDDKAAKNIIFEEKAIKNGYPNRFEAELQLLTPEQRESFELLSTIHEKIPGYNRKGMDGGQALKLATSHSKAEITQPTNYLLNKLKQGTVYDSPIGYLHSLITNRIQPISQAGQAERAAHYQREPRGRRRKPTQVFTYQPNTTPEFDPAATDQPLEVDQPVITEPIIPVVDLELKRRLKQVDRKAEWLSRLGVDGTALKVRFVGQIPDFSQTLWLSVVQRMYPQVTEIVVV